MRFEAKKSEQRNRCSLLSSLRGDTRFAPGGRNAAPKARGASFSHARRVGADDPVRPLCRRRRTSAIAPQCCFYGYTVTVAPRAFVLASSISLAPPQAAGLVHCAARPLQTANAALVCCLVPFLSCQKACRGGRLCAAVSDEGALRMRHTPCGCCPPDCAEGAELLSGCTGSAVFYSEAVTVPSATISFPSCGKRYGRKGRRTRSIALTRRKTSRYILRVSFPCP